MTERGRTVLWGRQEEQRSRPGGRGADGEGGGEKESWVKDYSKLIDVRAVLGKADRVQGSLHLLLLQRWKEVRTGH